MFGTLLGFIGGLAVDLARGMSLDRIRAKLEQAADPHHHHAIPEDSSSIDVLRQIRDSVEKSNNITLERGAGTADRTAVYTLYRGGGLERQIDRQGRKHLAVFAPSSGVVLKLITSAGTVNATLTAGVWAEIDPAPGTLFGLADTDPNASETVSVRVYN